jgi:hypothetical protein
MKCTPTRNSVLPTLQSGFPHVLVRGTSGLAELLAPECIFVKIRAPLRPSPARKTLGLVGKRTSGAVSYKRVIDKC